MSITRSAPGTVFLGGPRTQVNDLAANEVITPGMLIVRYTSSSKLRWKKADVAKAPGTTFATEQAMSNKGIDDTYAIGDLLEASNVGKGGAVYAIIASGANIAFGARLENAGNGKLRAWTDAAQAFEALEAVDNSAGPSDARIRVEVL